ncbi:MAG TPA: YihY/virulence factor BrkB family protein [Polyangiaceae bacterium]|nr:YihY/virulence factor BrkB family protein [Polyangiaceae bacterium]
MPHRGHPARDVSVSCAKLTGTNLAVARLVPSSQTLRRPFKLPAWVGTARRLIEETLDEYSKDRGDVIAAALAFNTLMSIAPFIIIAVAIAGAVLGRGAAEREVSEMLTQTMGTKAATTIEGWVREASDSQGVASVAGFALVIYTASRMTAQLRDALNQVWNVDVYQAAGFKDSVRDYVKRRAVALLLVIAAGPLLLLVFLSRTLLTGLHEVLFASSPAAGVLVQLGQFVFSLLLVAAISAVVFKLLPDTRVGWHAVTRGALLTSVLFNIGNSLVGLYLGRASVTQTYGAAGSAIVVLLWLYFSAQMFIYGAEFTQVYAKHYGRGLTPEEQRDVALAEREGHRKEAESAAHTAAPHSIN